MELDKKYRKSRVRLNLKYIANQGWSQIKSMENQGLDGPENWGGGELKLFHV